MSDLRPNPHVQPAAIPLRNDLGDGYRVVCARAGDGPQVLAALRRAGLPASVWKHDQLRNPLGFGMQLAYHQERVVAWLSLCLLPGMDGSRSLRLARVGSTWVDPSHRHGVGGGGLIARLARSAHNSLGEERTWWIRAGNEPEVPAGLQPLGLRPAGTLWTWVAPVATWAGGSRLQGVHLQKSLEAAGNLPTVGMDSVTRPLGVHPTPSLFAWRAAHHVHHPRVHARTWVRCKQSRGPARGKEAWVTCAMHADNPKRLWISDWWLDVQGGDPAALLCGAATVAREWGAEEVAWMMPQGSPLFAWAGDAGLSLRPSGAWLQWGMAAGADGPGADGAESILHAANLCVQPVDWGWV